MKIMKNRIDEYKEIKIHEFTWGHCSLSNLELNDFTIKLSNNCHKKRLGKGNISQPTIEIKNKGFNKNIKTNIDIVTFNNYYECFENLDFKNIYSENGSGYDGWELEIEITKKDGFLKYVKRIELFSPEEENGKSETNKLLEIYEQIKVLAKYEEYCKIIEKTRERPYCT